MSKPALPLEPVIYKNGVYPHATFPRARRRRRRLYLQIVDMAGVLAVCILIGGMFFLAVAVALGAFWLMLQTLDAVVRRLGA